MRMTKEQLLDAARRAAKYLPAASAELMNELANRLDVTSVALSESLEQRNKLAAENMMLKTPETWIGESNYGHEAYTQALSEGATYDEAMQAGVQGIIDAVKTPATNAWIKSLRAEIKAETIPDGWKLVPDQMHLEAEDIESICSQCGDGHENGYGEFTGAILWVGELADDDGKVRYGLNVASSECPEEGSLAVYEFVALHEYQGAQK